MSVPDQISHRDSFKKRLAEGKVANALPTRLPMRTRGNREAAALRAVSRPLREPGKPTLAEQLGIVAPKAKEPEPPKPAFRTLPPPAPAAPSKEPARPMEDTIIEPTAKPAVDKAVFEPQPAPAPAPPEDLAPIRSTEDSDTDTSEETLI